MHGPIMTRMANSLGYMALMGEIRMHDWDDPYGTASDWYLATAGVYWMETGEHINGYCPSILYRQGDWEHGYAPDGYSVDRIRDMIADRETTLEDIKLVNTVITRYLAWCVRDGKDY